MAIPFRNIAAFAHVSDVPTSIAFYGRLGFSARNTVVPDGESAPRMGVARERRRGADGRARGRAGDRLAAGRPLLPYVDDVAPKRDELLAAGIECGAIGYPFYNPRGEFRVHDPDGYVLMITHT